MSFVFGYAIGIGILKLCVRVLHVPTQVAPLIVVCVTVPAMFILTRAIFRE